MRELAVFSGNCLQGICGEATGYTDVANKPLYVGDIVIVYTDEYGPDELTVVVTDRWQTYFDGRQHTHVAKESHDGTFVMGIKSVPLDVPGAWRVRKVKGYEHAIEGEHWPAYGFSYRAKPEGVAIPEPLR